MANQIVSVHAGIYGMGIYAIMLPSSGFSVAHWFRIVAHRYPLFDCVTMTASLRNDMSL